MHRLRRLHPRMPGQCDLRRGRPAGRPDRLHQAERRAGPGRRLEEHHQAQARPARSRGVEGQDRQDLGAGALSQAPAPIETDALIIGAGPVGLFQAFQLGLLEISCHIVDALPAAGGQWVALNGHKPIYDMPGSPVTSGRDLAQWLLQQVAPLKRQFHGGEQVST
eukprot:Opistho-2@82593